MAGKLPLDFTSEEASRAMLNGLTSRIRDALRKRILESIEPDIEAAINAGLESFKATIESYREHENMRGVIRVLIERKDSVSPQQSSAPIGASATQERAYPSVPSKER